MPGAIRGKNGATPPRKTVGCQRNWTELGRGHHCAAGFTENLGLFEVPECTFIPLDHVHRMADLRKLPLEIIEMQVGSYFVEDDIIRLENIYRRTARNELAQEPSLCDDSSPAKTHHSRA